MIRMHMVQSLAWAQDLLDWTAEWWHLRHVFHLANISVAFDLPNEAVAEATMRILATGL